MLSWLRQSFLAFGIGTLLALASASPSLAHAQDTELPSGYESYLSRPDILKLKPKSHPELGPDWTNLKRGHVEAIAMLLEMYPDRELYFLARDSELLHDLARWITRDDPRASKRIHLLNISRANMRNLHTKEYLAQEGISEASLKAGKKVLFVDTGFSGTIPRVISEYFPTELWKNLQTHLMSSSNPEHPSTRVFLTAINPAAPGISPGKLHGSIISYEHMPRYTDRSTVFVKHEGVMQPLSQKNSSSDGTVSKDKALAYMEDLLSYVGEKETQELLSKRRHQWKRLRESTSPDQATKELKALLESSPQDPFVEAMVRDFVEIHQRTVESGPSSPTLASLSVASVGLNPVSDGAGQSNKNLLIKKYPEWASVLENPETGIASLLQKEEFGKLGAITDTIKDDEYIQVLCKLIGNKPPSPKVRKLVQTLIEKGDDYTHFSLALNTFPQPQSAWMKDELELLIETGNSFALKTIGAHVFSSPHTAEMKDLLKLLISKADEGTLENLARNTFNRSHTAGMQEELKLLIQAADETTMQTLARYTFSQPHAAKMKDALKLLIERANPRTMQLLGMYTFSEPHTAGMKDLIMLLIEKGDGDTLKSLAHQTFSKPHTAEMHSELKLLIEKASAETLHNLALSTFSQPHTAEMKDLLKLVIEKGDAATLRFLAIDAFSKPHTAGMKEELRLLIERADAGTLGTLAHYSLSKPHWSKPEHQIFRHALAIQDPETRRSFFAKNWKDGSGNAFFSITPDLAPSELIRSHEGRVLRVVKSVEQGKRGRVFQVMDSEGGVFALKVARDSQPETLHSLGQESTKATGYKKHDIPHAALLEAQPNYVLKEWIEGVRADEWMKGWVAAGAPSDAVEVHALQKLIQSASEKGVYIGDLNVKNLIWRKGEWVVVDSGSIREGLTVQEAMERYLEKIPSRWGKAVPAHGGVCLSKALKELLKYTPPVP